MRPVPSQLRQVAPFASRPRPIHSGQMSSPVPGVPGFASSPGLRGCSSRGLSDLLLTGASFDASLLPLPSVRKAAAVRVIAPLHAVLRSELRKNLRGGEVGEGDAGHAGEAECSARLIA